MREIVKTVALDDEKIRMLKSVFDAQHICHKLLAKMLKELCEQQAEAELIAWNSVAKLAGYTSKADAHRQGVSFQLDWLNSRVEVMKQPTSEEQAS